MKYRFKTLFNRCFHVDENRPITIGQHQICGQDEPPENWKLHRNNLKERLSSGTKCVVYPLTGRGFASEINNLLLAVLYCLNNGIRFQLESRDWNASGSCGWADFFLPFCDENQNERLLENARSLIKKDFQGGRYNSGDLFGGHIWQAMRSESALDQIFEFPELGIHGDIFHAKARLLSLIWAFNATTREAIRKAQAGVVNDSGYIGVHIRRGDKVTNRTKEADNIGAEEYVMQVLRLGLLRPPIFVASDDFEAIRQFKRASPSGWRVKSRTRRHTRGHFQAVFNSRNEATRYRMTIDCIADIHLLTTASVFVGTFSSNMGRLVCLLRNGNGCHSLDSEWHAL